VYNTGGKEKGGVGGKKGYILEYWRFLGSRFNLQVLLVNEHKTAQPSSCRTTRHLMNDKPQDEIRRGQFTTPGVAFASYIIFTAQTLSISEQTE